MADFGSNMKKIWMKGMEAIGNTASNIASNTRSKVDEMNLVTRRSEILKDFGNQAYSLWQKGERFPEELERQLQELKKLDEQLNDLRAERLAGVKTEAAAAALEAEEPTPAAEAEDGEEKPEDAAESAKETAEASEDGALDIPVIWEEKAETAETAEPEETAKPVETAEPEKSAEPEEQEETAEPERPETAPEEDPAAPEDGAAETKKTESVPSAVENAIDALFEKLPTAQEAREEVNKALDSLEEGLQAFSSRLDDKLDDLSEHMREE